MKQEKCLPRKASTSIVASTLRSTIIRKLCLLMLLVGCSAMTTFGSVKTVNTIISSLDSDVTSGEPESVVIRGRAAQLVVVGDFVDTCDHVDLPSGVSLTGQLFKDTVVDSSKPILFGQQQRTGRLTMNLSVSSSASLGEQELRIRYAVELAGPDRIRFFILRDGQVTNIQYRPSLVANRKAIDTNRTALIGQAPAVVSGALALLQPATNLPLNQKVKLVFSGTNIGNADVESSTDYRNQRVLPGGTETQCEVELEFIRSGDVEVHLFDKNRSRRSALEYRGLSSVMVSGSGQQAGSGGGGSAGVVVVGGTTPPPSTSSGTPPPASPDIAPAPVLNIFRRKSAGQSFSDGGVNYVEVDISQTPWCNGMTPPAGSIRGTKTITVPNIRWGVQNVGTVDINTPFDIALSSNGQVLQTQRIPAIRAGQILYFDFARQQSQVTLIIFANRPGCFISPTGTPTFEDPPFTVKVDTGGVIPEGAANKQNNTKTF